MRGSVKSQVKQAIPSFVIIIIMMILASILSEKFFTAANIRNVLTQTTVLSIVAVAQSMVLFIGGIDMSVSSVISISTIIMAMFSAKNGVTLTGAMALALAIGAVVGLVNGLGIKVFKIPAMIITISTQAFVKGICLILMPASGGSVNTAFASFVRQKIGVFSYAFILAGIMYVIMFLVLHKTRYGRDVYSVGNGELYAEQSGINTKKVVIITYVLAGMIAAFSGIILSARIASGNPLVGDSYAMDSVAAAVVGGISMNGGVGSVIGALFGSIILSLINNVMNNLGISPYFQYIIKGALLMISLMVFQIKRRKTA